MCRFLFLPSTYGRLGQPLIWWLCVGIPQWWSRAANTLVLNGDLMTARLPGMLPLWQRSGLAGLICSLRRTNSVALRRGNFQNIHRTAEVLAIPPEEVNASFSASVPTVSHDQSLVWLPTMASSVCRLYSNKCNHWYHYFNVGFSCSFMTWVKERKLWNSQETENMFCWQDFEIYARWPHQVCRKMFYYAMISFVDGTDVMC